MNFDRHSRARLYALTALACAIWLVQSLVEANGDGSLLTWSTIVFSLCLLLVTIYTGYNAVHDWNAPSENSTKGADGNHGKSD